MAIRSSKWPAGVPCWVDLGTPDVVAASAFYTAVLGWEIPEPDEQWGGYVVAAGRDGAAAAGIGPLSEGQTPAWTLYFATEDADATAAAIREAGGTVLADPFDVGTLGRMGIAADPTGATFGLWQAIDFVGAQLVNEIGGLVWEDLRSTEPKQAQDFYAAVFGHVLEALPDAGPEYQLFHSAAGEPPLGGMGGLFGIEAPSHWAVYLAVEDAVAAAEAAVAHGGAELRRDLDTPFGAMVALADPWGAEFIAFKPAPGPQPDREG